MLLTFIYTVKKMDSNRNLFDQIFLSVKKYNKSYIQSKTERTYAQLSKAKVDTILCLSPHLEQRGTKGTLRGLGMLDDPRL